MLEEKQTVAAIYETLGISEKSMHLAVKLKKHYRSGLKKLIRQQNIIS